MKTMLLLCALVVGSNAWAGSITFADLDLVNGEQYSDPFDGGDFIVTFAGGGNDGKYYNTGKGIRVYGGGTMTIAAKSGKMSKIVITYSGSSYAPSAASVVNVGTYDVATHTWTGDAASVVFTRPSGTGHWRVQSITVTLSGATPTCATPSISPNGGSFLGSQEVSITCDTDGATIYYTLDGNDPTTSSTQYNGAFTITESKTVKAFAVKGGMNNSEVASATFTKTTVSANIAAFVATGSAGFVQLTDALVTYKNGTTAYIEDASGAILLYHCAGDLEAGDKINGIMNVTSYTVYSNLPEIQNFSLMDGYTKTSGNTVTPTEVTLATLLADYNSYLSRYVVIKGATVTSAFDSKNCTIQQGVDEIALRDQNSSATLTSTLGANINVTAHVAIYSTTKQIAVYEQSQIEEYAPISISDAGLATFASDFDLDFTSVEGVEAYIAKEEAGAVKLTKVNKVPAGTGVLLRSTAGGAVAKDVPVAASADAIAENIFVRGTGATVATDAGAGKTNYVLGKKSGVVGFYKANGATVGADKAYLQTTVSAARINIDFDDATAIEAVKAQNVENGQFFNVAGQRVAQPTKGLYIVNGKKVIIK